MSEEAGIDGNSNRTVFEEVSFVPTQHSSLYLRHLVPLTIDPHLRDFFLPSTVRKSFLVPFRSSRKFNDFNSFLLIFAIILLII